MCEIPENMDAIIAVVCSCQDEYFDVEDVKHLWHYTDLEAVHGILSSKVVRLGNARFMNDPKEISGSIEELRKILKQVLKTYDSEFLESMGIKFDGILQRNNLRPNSYLASFTSQEDQLTHWLCYSNKEHGAAIKVNAKALCEWVDEMGTMAKVVKVIYSQEKKKEIIYRFIDQIGAVIISNKYSKDEMVQVCDFIDVFFETCIVAFKHESWKHECEYRIHILNENAGSLKHKFQGTQIRPYIEREFVPNKLISEIILLKDDKLRSTTLKEYLASMGMESIAVGASKNEVTIAG